MCTRELLLYEFRDNDTQAITADSMRLFVNCVYDNFLQLDSIVDNLITYDPQKSLSANQGAILNEKIEDLNQITQELDTNKANTIDVYNKSEIDSNFYNNTWIDANVYTKNKVYNKSEISHLLSVINHRLVALDNRITNIVQKNNLIE